MPENEDLEIPGATVFDLSAHRIAASRPVVHLTGGKLPHIIDDAEKVLGQNDPEIFEFGGHPVYLGCEPTLQNQYAPHPRRTMFRYEAAHLTDQWTRFVDFQKFDARTKKWRSVDCPVQIASAYIQRKGRRRLRRLRSVMSTPTLRPDGSILDRPGYDSDTGLFYDPCSVEYPPLPVRPTIDDAQRALELLLEPIELFPFVPDDAEEPTTSASRSVTLSGMLTALVRPSLATAPLHSSTAPVAGSGKSMLDNIVSILATGRTCHPVAETTNTEEFEKRLATALIKGEQIIGLDNCTVPLGGGLLCQAVTEETIAIRDFGVLREVDIPNASLILANGNNLVIKGDILRRTLRAQLDPHVERPELRKFAFSPVKMAAERRPQLVTAALTVLRAYVVAGRPNQHLDPLGSFDDWSNWPRSALVWLGEPDPCLTMAAARETDPELRQIRALLHSWGALFTSACTIKRAIQEAREHSPAPNLKAQRAVLLEALEAVAGEHKDINTRKLGNWLARHKGRVVDGRCFKEVPSKRGVAMWLVSSRNC